MPALQNQKDGGFMKQKLMQGAQRFGGAMFTPVMLLAFSGMVIGIATLFTSSQI